MHVSTGVWVWLSDLVGRHFVCCLKSLGRDKCVVVYDDGVVAASLSPLVVYAYLMSKTSYQMLGRGVL